MSSEYLFNMYVINLMYFQAGKSAIEVGFCIILCASFNNRVPLTTHLPHQTRTYTPKNQKLHQQNHSIELYQHIGKYVALEWCLCIGTMLFLYNSIHNNYKSTCQTYYPSFNPTSFLGENRSLGDGISYESLFNMYVINPLHF